MTDAEIIFFDHPTSAPEPPAPASEGAPPADPAALFFDKSEHTAEDPDAPWSANYTELAGRLGLQPDAAGRLIDHDLELLNVADSSRLARHWREVEQWKQDLRAADGVGGAHFADNLELARRTAHHFGGREFVALLEQSGFAHHPLLVRALAAAGHALGQQAVNRRGSSVEALFYGAA